MNYLSKVFLNGQFKKEMAGVTGLEPATSGVTGLRSNQLSYTPQGDLMCLFLQIFPLSVKGESTILIIFCYFFY